MKLLMTVFALFTLSLSESAQAVHVRFQETSITENGRVQSAPDVRLQTKGYGVTWIFPIGLGVAYTQLDTIGKSDSTKVELKHTYLDVNYTAGETWLATIGYGVGIAGSAKIGGESTDEFRATSWSLGVGYRISALELYWINRLNFPRYKIEGNTLNVTSTHYQLGVGIFLP